MEKHDEFEDFIREMVADLPEWVQEALHNIEFLVHDEADEYLDPDGEGLLGLYTGVPLPEYTPDGRMGYLPRPDFQTPLSRSSSMPVSPPASARSDALPVTGSRPTRATMRRSAARRRHRAPRPAGGPAGCHLAIA